MIEDLPERIHCLGAGGAGMLPLALCLAEAGHAVTAEDDAFTAENRELLESRGVEVRAFAKGDAAGIVYSSAIADTHPARAYALETGALCIRRGECLALVAKQKKLVAIAGSHGKTTTCGMLIDALEQAGADFSYLLGAQFDGLPPSRFSESEWLVAEIDESDGTIEGFSPEITVVLNVDHDHHARYETEADYWAAFARLVERTQGKVFVEASLKDRLRASAKVPLLGLGEKGDVDVSAKPSGSSWSELTFSGETALRQVSINRSGRMNTMDASFALLAAEAMGAPLAAGQRVEFTSVRRRQRCWFNSPAVQVFEDYAHHPREIDAVLESMGEKPGWQTVVVFQAHRFSRTRELKAEFAKSLSVCEELVLLDVYAASESPLEGGTGQDLYQECRKRSDRVIFISSVVDPVPTLQARARQGAVRIVFLGAGVGDKVAKRLSEALAAEDKRWGQVYRGLASVSSFSTVIRADEPMANKTTLRVGGPAERYFEPESLAQLVAALKVCRSEGIEVRPLGRGSNLVVADDGVSGLVIRLSHPYWSRFELLGAGRARLGAGMRIKALCGQAAKEGLEGFEFLEGIPGSLGGVLRMNAGAMGGWVFDVVESIRYVTLEGEVLEARKDDLDFGYRYCRELESAIAIDAVFVSKGSAASQAEIRRTIDTYQSKRKESQPREPSAGCIFKNPEGDSAGRLIDELGLKGAMVGGAEISSVHGNFIINRGGASSSDVVELVKFARKVARERKGVDLHPEVLLFGSNWEEALK
ncbi:UDP-N-acetylmuramate dehydrogenase [Pelagicoccus sp. SDUM812005]|uniref:UDP-N-acetylmuramate dehydrogenase n=1 Tax=Pelagicoccus sp. SDUM812005 TaxID=3041257 RepID=UPI00280E3301|nr:UDP-N-acetylmuramate dehydrogenase [Pelagicoccus sp. SDUM812005]MDQ8180578.1 UDP-N-acetylmuramate dehydrogenase [Pelagicoccus sp. SDUM812005]